ncbi:MAG: DNA polymerase III subunit delta' [Leptolyngbya sp. SIOISBB]|nr:DNA polymerase III subunit delta' [Leptolyngbya sp. SIOISBB]
MVQTVFTGLLGQATAVDLLNQAIRQARIAPAYLFAGPSGVGRRLAALRFAECLLQDDHAHLSAALRRRIEARNHPDLLWVEPTYLHKGKPVTVAEAVELDLKRKSPPQIRLEQIREIARFLSRPTLEAQRAVVVLEGAETMAESPANGLLKTLEEPGAATLILLAEDSARLLPTIISRCQTIPFRRLSQETMTVILQQTGHTSILQRPDILAMAQGSPGQAIAAWEQLNTIPEEIIAAVSNPPTNLRAALDLARQVSKEMDIESQLWLVDYLQQVTWEQQRSADPLQALEQARRHLRRFVQPRLVWEVTLMQFVQS